MMNTNVVPTSTKISLCLLVFFSPCISSRSLYREDNDGGEVYACAHSRYNAFGYRSNDSTTVCLVEDHADHVLRREEADYEGQFERAKNYAGERFDDLKEGVKDVARRGKENIQWVGEKVAEKATAVKNRLTDAAQDTASSVKQSAAETRDKAKNVAQRAATTTKNAAQNAAAKAKNVVNNAADATKQGARKVADTAQATTEKAKGALSNAYNATAETVSHTKNLLSENARHVQALVGEIVKHNKNIEQEGERHALQKYHQDGLK